MAWVGLQEEIAETFDGLVMHIVHTNDRDGTYEILHGFHVAHPHLTTTRATTKDTQTEAQRKEKRRLLENKRRAYKTAKQREYDARKRAA